MNKRTPFQLRSGNTSSFKSLSGSPLKNPYAILRLIGQGAKSAGRYIKNPKGLLKDTVIWEVGSKIFKELQKTNKNNNIVDQDRPGRNNKYGVGTPKI